MKGMYQALLKQIGDLKERLDGIPSFRWATVVTAKPLRVVLDGDIEALPEAPFSLVTVSAPGQRVLALLVNRRVVLLGVNGGEMPPPPEPNVLWIDGVKYPASGAVSVQVGSFPYWDGKVAATTLQIPFPCDLPQGWTFETFSLHSWSFTVVQTGEVDRSTRRIKSRAIQFYANSVNALSQVGWRLVRE